MKYRNMRRSESRTFQKKAKSVLYIACGSEGRAENHTANEYEASLDLLVGKTIFRGNWGPDLPEIRH